MRPNGRLSFAAETKLRLEVLTGLWKTAKKDRKEICRKNVAVQEMQFCYTWTENRPQERNRREEYMSLACVTVACYLLFFSGRARGTLEIPPLFCVLYRVPYKTRFQLFEIWPCIRVWGLTKSCSQSLLPWLRVGGREVEYRPQGSI